MADNDATRALIVCEGLPSTRQEALEIGSQFYFTGRPCRKGHIAKRETARTHCCECRKNRTNGPRQEWYARNAERERQRNRDARKKNPERYREYDRQKREREGEKKLARDMDYYHRNKERILAAGKIKYAENKEFYRAKAAADYEKNKEKISAGRKLYYTRTREASIAKTRQWCVENPEKVRELRRNRRARMRNAEGTHTAEDVSRIRDLQKDKCASCGVRLKGKGQVDHIIPLAKGGSNWPKNLQILCAPCNISKNARDPIEFMQSKGLLL